jgi:hypothetical protein
MNPSPGRVRQLVRLRALAGLLLLLCPSIGESRTLNGFELSGALIPEQEILRGGPPRDGIPALSRPATTSAPAAEWPDDEWVVGVSIGGEARAYPMSILLWHELVNDRLGGEALLISYCPLCGSALVFRRHLPEGDPGPGPKTLRFGVSGLLYQSDLLMYDRETESLWSQIEGRAVTGPLAGRRLSIVRSRIEPWSRWRARHPESRILSRETGHRRRYGESPYGDYARSRTLYFPAPRDERFHAKMRTLGLRGEGGVARAYPLIELERAGGRIEERFAGHPVVVRLDAESKAFSVEAPPGVDVIESYWFAWMAFHPGSSVFVAPRRPPAVGGAAGD